MPQTDLTRIHGERRNAGFALLLALGLLAIFGMLGTAWLEFTRIEFNQTRYEQWDFHARQAARGGVMAAIGEIRAALEADPGAVENLLGVEKTREFPVFQTVKTDEDTFRAVEKPDGAKGQATYVVTDECARVNVNLAPIRVLRALFGEQGDLARGIRLELPRAESGGPTAEIDSRRWLFSVDELVTRSLVDEDTLAAVGEDLLTVYTGTDLSGRDAFVNVNTATAPVLAAVLGVDLSTAEKVAGARPFQSVEELAAAAGKDPATFNIASEAADAGSVPPGVLFTSRCFRIVSESQLNKPNDKTLGHARVETVVFFNESGEPEIRFWNEARKREG